MKVLVSFLFILSGCGKFEDSLNKLNPLSPVSNSMNNINSNKLEAKSIDVTPGSYYGLVTDESTNQDIIVHEFQYLGDESFIIKETRFIAGNLATGYFHSTTGTYKLELGVVKHEIKKDSCNKLDPFSLTFTGDKGSSVKTTFRSRTLSLYTFSKFTPPSYLLNQLSNSIEDTGCQKFP